MKYLEARFSFVKTLDFVKDLLVAGLAELGFESFVENDDATIVAYIQSQLFDELKLKDFISDFDFKDKIALTSLQSCEDKDWNEEWEKNSFQPIMIADKLLVRAPFHNIKNDGALEIIINPRMAFGTGTHQTTSLILTELLNLDLDNKSVLDMGCGTGILGIAALKLGAASACFVDIDDWCTDNTLENLQLNNIKAPTQVLTGDGRMIDNKSFDVILANINRNILLMDMNRYVESLNQGGRLLMSGFLKEDIEKIKAKSESVGLIFIKYELKDNWAMCITERKS